MARNGVKCLKTGRSEGTMRKMRERLVRNEKGNGQKGSKAGMGSE